ncbi:hypothetical protein [Synechococcus sp. MW101C3]|uniref:hypothetical protein n=1 Tax=Synechococcus sp. MW101C3 TaxID=210768 RepID=UPI000B9941F1|nr:hypothetical protein [Synechococcus sp. MW101C3]
MLIYACVSGHGFGHGSRVASVLLALAALRPRWRLVLSTSLPPSFLQLALAGVPFEHRPLRWDVGAIQADALGVDGDATLAALEAVTASLPPLLEAEAHWLQQQGEPVLLLGDVPPAAARLAALVRRPLVWMGNFGWDDIYAPMGGAFLDWAERFHHDYRRGTHVIRCPFSMAMDWGLPETAVGLTAAAPQLAADALRQRLDLPAERERCVMVSFGGLGFALGPEPYARWPGWTFVTTDASAAAAPNVHLLPADVRPLELMRLCGRQISKAGYSTFCEALGQGTGVHLVERHGFAEAAVLEGWLRRHGRHLLLSQPQLLAGDWQLDQPLLPPSDGPLAADGAQQAAAQLVQLAEGMAP